MTDIEYTRKLAQLDRLLNDPDVPMRPSEVWDLLAEISAYDVGIPAATTAVPRAS